MKIRQVISIKTEYLLLPPLLLLCAFQLVGNSALSVGMVIIIIAATAFFHMNCLISALYLCLPFFNLMNPRMGGTSLYYLLILLFAARYLFSRGEKYRLPEKMWLLAFLLLLRVWDLNGRFLAWYLSLLPLVLSYGEEFFTGNLSRVVSAYSTAMSLSCGFGYYLQQRGLSVYTQSYVYNMDSVTTRFAGLIGDSVVLGQILSLLIALQLVTLNEKSSGGFSRCLSIILLTAFGLMTYSRAFIVTVFLCLLAYIFMRIVKRRTISVKRIAGVFAAAVILTVTFFYCYARINGVIISNYLERFSAADFWTGRISIAAHYFDIFKQNPLYLLTGMRYDVYTEPFWPAGFSRPMRFAHNIYIESVCLFGIFVAAGIFFAVVVRLIGYIRRNGVNMRILPIIVLLVYGLILHGHFEFSYYSGAALALGTMPLSRKESSQA